MKVAGDEMDTQDKLRIVLCEWRVYQRFEQYSLGLFHLEAALQKADYDPQVLICGNGPVDKVCGEILAHRPQVVGLKLYKDNQKVLFELARLIKAADPQIKIVLGGHLATLYGYLVLNLEAAIDIVIEGEGEATLVDLCRHLENGLDLSGCPGIFYKQDGFVFKGVSREAIRDLDVLAYPQPQKFSPKDRRAVVQVGLSTARGCMGNCCYCGSNQVFRSEEGGRWRGISPRRVGEEIKRLADFFGEQKLIINFVDSAFENPDPLVKTRVTQIMEQIEAQRREIAFSIFTRAESWTRRDIPLIDKMRQAGLYKVSLGFDESLQFRDPFELTANALAGAKKQAWKLFHDRGLRICGFLILFHPFITLEQLKQSAVFLREIEMAYHPESWTHTLELYPNTAIFNYVVDTGLLTGVEDNRYAYRYSFYDGRVEPVQRLMARLRKLESYQAYRNTVAKIDYELDIYHAWRNRAQLFGEAADEIDRYLAGIRAHCNETGVELAKLFSDVIESVAKDFDKAKPDLVAAYHQVFTARRAVLETEWLQYRLQLGRKKVRLA
jgi:anaerobic magnesium-protoporphyrin IX monomethyl ester cyclase